LEQEAEVEARDIESLDDEAEAEANWLAEVSPHVNGRQATAG
jgi:hypothetical protein